MNGSNLGGANEHQDFRNLSLAYTREDQKLMKSGEWDACNPVLITNRVKTLLEQIDQNYLSESDREWWSEILWFWYHHAVSYAIWRARDRALAQAYSEYERGEFFNNRTREILRGLFIERVNYCRTSQTFATTLHGYEWGMTLMKAWLKTQYVAQ